MVAHVCPPAAADAGARLEMGSEQYGDWEPGRDWAEEAKAEALDGLNYCAAAAVHGDPSLLRAQHWFALAYEELERVRAQQGGPQCQQ